MFCGHSTNLYTKTLPSKFSSATSVAFFQIQLSSEIKHSIKRIQHRFGGMWDECKNGGGMWDDKNFNGRMRDKNILAGAGFANFDRVMWDSFKIDGM